MAWFETLMAALAAAILFLYGIDHLSVEIQRVAGERLRGLLAKLTSNKWTGAAIGAITTAVIQSSTATTIITVGLVNSGMLTFGQSLGVLAGANVGTTITAQIVAFNLIGLGPVFLVIGFILSVAGGKYKFLGKSIFYFGLVFFSLLLVSEALLPLRNDPMVMDYATKLSNPLLGLLFGIAVTLVFQSSAVTTGMAVLLGMQGFLSLGQAIPMVFGANIGTTSTTIIASSKMDAYARKTAYAHLLFNIIGVVIFFPFLGQFENVVQALGGDTGRMIANAHMLFNVSTALVFLILSERVAEMLSQLVKTDKREIVFRTKFIDGRVPESTAEAVANVRKEMAHELDLIKDLYSTAFGMVRAGNADELQRTIKLEGISDFLDDRISEYLAVLSRRELSEEQARDISRLARISNELEQLADLGEDVSRIGERMERKAMKLADSALEEILPIERLFFQNLELLEGGLEQFSKKDLARMRLNRKKMSWHVEAAYLSHINRLKKVQAENFAGTNFTDLLATLESANVKIVGAMEQLSAIS